MKGLSFWFKSLSNHLGKSLEVEDELIEGSNSKNKEALYSIIVVGTFLDHPNVDQNKNNEREKKVRLLAQESNINPQRILYVEVSCSTLENIEELKKVIFVKMASHSYMGERVPKSYTILEKVMERLLKTNPDFPIVGLDLISNQTGIEMNVIKRGLRLLSMWGKCVYFDEPAELSDLVILDPKFLTKEVLAQLFNPEIVKRYLQNGILKHIDLKQIWKALENKISNFNELCPKLMELMYKFEVCFLVEGEGEKGFWDRKSVIPGLLNEKKPEELKQWWVEGEALKNAIQYQNMIHIEKYAVFDCEIPNEMIGRMMVRMHHLMKEKLMWRNGMYFKRDRSQALIVIEKDSNDSNNKFYPIYLGVRGIDRKECMNIMADLTNQIEIVSKLYSGLKYQQMVKSPFVLPDPNTTKLDSKDFISLQTCLDEYNKPEKDWNLRCPKTQMVIHVQKLLTSSGILDDINPQQKGFLFILFLCSFFFFPKNMTK